MLFPSHARYLPTASFATCVYVFTWLSPFSFFYSTMPLSGSSPVVQQDKDPVLPLQQLELLLLCGYNPWPRNFCMLQAWPKKKKQKKKKKCALGRALVWARSCRVLLDHLYKIRTITYLALAPVFPTPIISIPYFSALFYSYHT